MVAHADGRDYPHDADNRAQIYEDGHGHLWVTHEELLKCGYILLNDFDVVYLNRKFYELQAYVRRPKSWWVEEVEDKAPDESLVTPEAVARQSQPV